MKIMWSNRPWLTIEHAKYSLTVFGEHTFHYIYKQCSPLICMCVRTQRLYHICLLGYLPLVEANKVKEPGM